MRTGFIGWRGMVGSVLLERMLAEGDEKDLDLTFYSTSAAGKPGPEVGTEPLLQDAFDIDHLKSMETLVSCQGGDYTKKVHAELRKAGWKGYWVDAASALRMSKDSLLILDPVNRDVIDRELDAGCKDLIGGNCTVSLMLMALGPLFKNNLVEWVSAMTYQAASGAGARQMRELLEQMGYLQSQCRDLLAHESTSAIALEAESASAMRSSALPSDHLGYPLAASLLPWIDSAVDEGQTREEWKAMVEGNKILGREANPIPMDGICVRVSSLRCHSQAFTIKMNKELPLDEIEDMLSSAHDWTEVIPNTQEETLSKLTPAAVTGSLQVPVGRLHHLKMGKDYLGAFSVGDQLLWGAAEPLRRILRILLERN